MGNFKGDAYKSVGKVRLGNGDSVNVERSMHLLRQHPVEKDLSCSSDGVEYKRLKSGQLVVNNRVGPKLSKADRKRVKRVRRDVRRAFGEAGRGIPSTELARQLLAMRDAQEGTRTVEARS